MYIDHIEFIEQSSVHFNIICFSSLSREAHCIVSEGSQANSYIYYKCSYIQTLYEPHPLPIRLPTNQPGQRMRCERKQHRLLLWSDNQLMEYGDVTVLRVYGA